jgi:hypothetical protein
VIASAITADPKTSPRAPRSWDSFRGMGGLRGARVAEPNFAGEKFPDLKFGIRSPPTHLSIRGWGVKFRNLELARSMLARVLDTSRSRVPGGPIRLMAR